MATSPVVDRARPARPMRLGAKGLARTAAKTLARQAATLFVLPLASMAGFGRWAVGFQFGGQCLALVPGLAGDYLRTAYYALTLRSASNDARISFGSFFSRSESVIEPGVYIGAYCVLGACEIGARTQVASHVQIMSGRRQHARGPNGEILGSSPANFTRVHIGADCWLGAGAIVMDDVGAGSTVGAGAVVTRPVPAGVTVVGNPARPLPRPPNPPAQPPPPATVDAAHNVAAEPDVPRVLAFMEATTLTGPAKNLLAFARHVRGRAEVRVATFVRGPHAQPNAFMQACASAGVAVEPIHERCVGDPSVIPQMRRLARTYGPDIVQTHSVKSHFLVRLSGLGRRRSWIAFHHGYTATNKKVGLYNRLDRLSLPRARRVVTVCRPFARDLERIGVAPERISVLHNSVRPYAPVAGDALAGLRASLGIAPSDQVVVSVGRLSREKGHGDLIKAAAALHASDPRSNVRLVIVGDGPDLDALRRLAVREGVADRVLFAGHASDVRPYYALADLFVLPSLSEGSPNVLLEAMAAGLPIVATAVGGVPEIATDERQVLLVPPSLPDRLAAAMMRLLHNSLLARQLGAQARAAVASRTPEAYSDAVLAIYHGALGALAPSRLRAAAAAGYGLLP